MGRGIISKQEVTAPKYGANALLCCFTDLRGKDCYFKLFTAFICQRLGELKQTSEINLWLAVHREAQQAVVSLQSRWISPDGHVLLPQ